MNWWTKFGFGGEAGVWSLGEGQLGLLGLLSPLLLS